MVTLLNSASASLSADNLNWSSSPATGVLLWKNQSTVFEMVHLGEQWPLAMAVIQIETALQAAGWAEPSELAALVPEERCRTALRIGLAYASVAAARDRPGRGDALFSRLRSTILIFVRSMLEQRYYRVRGEM